MNIIDLIKTGQLFEAKKALIAELDEERQIVQEEFKKFLGSTILSEARFKIVRVRIRKGKVQRRKKVSTLKGYTMRGGRLTRISSMERRNRKLGARRGKIKRKAKQARALMNRRKSLRKLKAVGGGRK